MTGVQTCALPICFPVTIVRTEEVKLARRVRRGDTRARELMIKSNLRLVVKIAADYNHCGLPILDLISEGNLGLMKAVDRFKPSRGVKFSTYACWWIKQSIRRALANQGKTVRLPVHLVDKIQRLRRVSSALGNELGREPTDAELADELQVETGRVTKLREVSAVYPAPAPYACAPSPVPTFIGSNCLNR